MKVLKVTSHMIPCVTSGQAKDALQRLSNQYFGSEASVKDMMAGLPPQRYTPVHNLRVYECIQ